MDMIVNRTVLECCGGICFNKKYDIGNEISSVIKKPALSVLIGQEFDSCGATYIHSINGMHSVMYDNTCSSITAGSRRPYVSGC